LQQSNLFGGNGGGNGNEGGRGVVEQSADSSESRTLVLQEGIGAINVSCPSTANPVTPVQSRPAEIKPWVGAGHIVLPIPATPLVSVSVCL